MTDRPVMWTSNDAVRAMDAPEVEAFVATGVSIDSRTLDPGDLFFAIKGPNLDGHDFVAHAIGRGAAAAVVHWRPENLPGTAPLLVVSDTHQALESLARAARRRTQARIIAVTGSVGKTGTKEALRLALSEQGKTTASAGNLNNEWGVPLSLARLPADDEYGILELAMNHAGELGPLSRLVRPDVGVITNIAAVHMANFASTFDITDAKAEIFEGMANGVAILNRDNPYFPVLLAAACSVGVDRVLSFGAHPDASVRLVESTLTSANSEITATVDCQVIRYSVSAPGRHWIINSLCVLAAVHAVGADVEAAARTLIRIRVPDGRGSQHHVDLPEGRFVLIDESYNASPVAMRAAFETLAVIQPGPGGRRIAVLGDMLELGANTSAMHAALATTLCDSGIDLVYTAGHEMTHLRDAIPAAMRGEHADSAQHLAPIVANAVRPGDVITVKGSHGIRMDHVVDALIRIESTPQRAVNHR